MKKSLIMYYSWSQTTATVAKLLQTATQGDLVAVTVAPDTFSTDMYSTSDIAKQQLATQQLPALTNPLPAFDQYEQIFVGGPVWSGQVATPIRQLLTQLRDYQGTLLPFYTDAGTAGQYQADFRQLVQGVRVTRGLELSGGTVRQPAVANQQIQAWLKRVAD